MQFALMNLIFTVDSDIIERRLSFRIGPFLGLIEGYFDKFSLIVVVAFDTA